MLRNPRQIPIKNTYAGVIPKYSAVEVTGETTINQNLVFNVTRPSAAALKYLLFTGPDEIAQDAMGYATRSAPFPVAYSGDDPSVGDSLGSEADVFTLTANGHGFIVYAVDTGDNLVYVAPG